MQLQLLVLFWISLCVANETSSSSTSSSVKPTLVWATGTDENGVTKTTLSRYTQQFSTLYFSVASPSVGLIGLGTLSGLLADTRTYARTTISENNALEATSFEGKFLILLCSLLLAL